MRLSTIDWQGGTAAVVESKRGLSIIKDPQGKPYTCVGDLLRRAPEWRAAAEKASGEAPIPTTAAVHYRRAITAPGAIACVGLNYRKHILEMKREIPTVPTLFSKLVRALTDPGAAIVLPAASQMVDYEAELVVVIGKGGRNLSKDRAWDAIAGLTIMNDVTMRDFQKRSLQWFAGKTWEKSTPLGSTMVTPDELGDLSKRVISTHVNDEERQRSELGDLVFDVPTLVSDLSQVFTLEPGDIIATGTPGGVGDAMKPPCYLKDGDEVVIRIEGIGELRNRFTRTA